MQLIIDPVLGQASIGSKRIALFPVDNEGTLRVENSSGPLIRSLNFDERNQILVNSITADSPVAFCIDLLTETATVQKGSADPLITTIIALKLAAGEECTVSLSHCIELVMNHTGWSVDTILNKKAAVIDSIAQSVSPPKPLWNKIIFPSKNDRSLEHIIRAFTKSLLKRVDQKIVAFVTSGEKEYPFFQNSVQHATAPLSYKHNDYKEKIQGVKYIVNFSPPDTRQQTHDLPTPATINNSSTINSTADINSPEMHTIHSVTKSYRKPARNSNTPDSVAADNHSGTVNHAFPETIDNAVPNKADFLQQKTLRSNKESSLHDNNNSAYLKQKPSAFSSQYHHDERNSLLDNTFSYQHNPSYKKEISSVKRNYNTTQSNNALVYHNDNTLQDSADSRPDNPYASFPDTSCSKLRSSEPLGPSSTSADRTNDKPGKENRISDITSKQSLTTNNTTGAGARVEVSYPDEGHAFLPHKQKANHAINTNFQNGKVNDSATRSTDVTTHYSLGRTSNESGHNEKRHISSTSPEFTTIPVNSLELDTYTDTDFLHVADQLGRMLNEEADLRGIA